MDYSRSKLHMENIGMSPNIWNNRVIVEEALRRGLTVEAGRRRNSLRISDNTGKQISWRGGANSLNHASVKRITSNKEVCSSLLRAYGVPGTVNAVFDKGEASRAWLWAEKFNSIVVKPADGIHGKNVHVDIRTLDDFLHAFDDVANVRSGKVLVEEFYSGTEHRCLVIGQKLVAVIHRLQANVIGDGHSTIRELTAEKNKNRAPIHKTMVLDSVAEKLLAEQGLNADSIPSEGKRVFIKRVSNGGDFIDATGTLSANEVELVEQAARVLTGGAVLGFDVLLPRGTGESEIRIIEVNTNPMIAMHHFPWEGKPRNVASAVLDLRFPDVEP